VADVVNLANFRDQWPVVEKAIRDIVAAAGCDDATANWVAADFKKRGIRIAHVSPTNFDHFPAEVRPLIAEMSEEWRRAYGCIMIEWLKKIVDIQIDLCGMSTNLKVSN